MMNEEFGPWTSAGVHDNTVSDFLKRKILKENNSIFLFELFCLVVSLAALFASLLFTPLYVTAVITVIAGIFVYLVSENNRERVIINRLLDAKKYQICEVEAYELASSKASKKYCYVKDMQGNIFYDEKKTQPLEPQKVTYHWYFNSKENKGIMVKMPKGTKGMYYVVLPAGFLERESK